MECRTASPQGADVAVAAAEEEAAVSMIMMVMVHHLT